MKTLTVRVAPEQLSQALAANSQNCVVVLTDGERQLLLEASPALALDPEEDSQELARELLKASTGPFTAYSRRDLEAVAERVRAEKT